MTMKKRKTMKIWMTMSCWNCVMMTKKNRQDGNSYFCAIFASEVHGAPVSLCGKGASQLPLLYQLLPLPLPVAVRQDQLHLQKPS
jgi:hypothetical protein